MTPTTVVNLHYDAYDVYIGRAGRGKSGYFGNPFRDFSRVENVASFRRYFLHRVKIDPVYARRVRELRGKVLGCFCKPLACHGDVFVEWLDSSDRS